MLHYDFTTTGQKPAIMVAAQFRAIVDRLDYVQPVIWEGSWDDLTGAVKQAKRDFDEVVITSTYGREFPINQRLSSFQLDQWHRAGCLDKWDTLPLVLPRPANAKELATQYIKGPTILYADHSQSSPFPHKDELYAMLKDDFGATHKILRLSEVRLDNPLDLLALYDAASLIIAVETMHVHLSKATDTPVIALATDTPSPWHGSAPSKRFRFYCRYSEFDTRCQQLIEAARAALKGVKPNASYRETGKVSCIIPILKPDAAMLNKCLEAVLPQVDEVITTRELGGIVPDGTITSPKLRHVIGNESGVGFGRNVNFGAKHATGELLLILNDDLYIAPDAVQKMLDVMDEKTGAVGHLLRYPNGTIYFGGQRRIPDGFTHVDWLNVTPTLLIPTELEDLNGAAWIVRRKAFEQVGGYNEEIKFYADDDFLSMKLRQAGWKLMYTPFAMSVHDCHRESHSGASGMNLAEVNAQSMATFEKHWKFYFQLNAGNQGMGRFK